MNAVQLSLDEALKRQNKQEQDRRYYEAHRQEKIQYQREYYATHREQQLEQHRRYCKDHAEEVRERRRRGYHHRLRPCVECGKPCRGRGANPRCQQCAGHHFHYKGGWIDTDGYRGIFKKGRRGLEHRFIWEAANGSLPEGWVVHHINGDRLDNRLENLAAMTRGQHNMIHVGGRRRSHSGRGAQSECGSYGRDKAD